MQEKEVAVVGYQWSRCMEMHDLDSTCPRRATTPWSGHWSEVIQSRGEQPAWIHHGNASTVLGPAAPVYTWLGSSSQGAANSVQHYYQTTLHQPRKETMWFEQHLGKAKLLFVIIRFTHLESWPLYSHDGSFGGRTGLCWPSLLHQKPTERRTVSGPPPDPRIDLLFAVSTKSQ